MCCIGNQEGADGSDVLGPSDAADGRRGDHVFDGETAEIAARGGVTQHGCVDETGWR